MSKCSYCGEILYGRRDKKFCDDLCRSQSFKLDERKSLIELLSIQAQLKKNYKILKDKAKLVKNQLMVLEAFGFNINVFSFKVDLDDGVSVFACADIYYYLDLDSLIIIENQSNLEFSKE